MTCQLPQQLHQLRVHPVWSLDSKLVTLTPPPRLKQDYTRVESDFPDMMISRRYRNRCPGSIFVKMSASCSSVGT